MDRLAQRQGRAVERFMDLFTCCQIKLGRRKEVIVYRYNTGIEYSHWIWTSRKWFFWIQIMSVEGEVLRPGESDIYSLWSRIWCHEIRAYWTQHNSRIRAGKHGIYMYIHTFQIRSNCGSKLLPQLQMGSGHRLPEKVLEAWRAKFLIEICTSMKYRTTDRRLLSSEFKSRSRS
jgi:hypothetical protein